jgi:ribosomal protein S27AE
MWIAMLAVVVIVVAVWFWAVSRDKYICPICGHSMSEHTRWNSEDLTRKRSFCKLCDKECQ